jgi:hypothetical protein
VTGRGAVIWRCAAILALLAASALPARALEAAAGKVDITPDLATEKTWLAGFGSRGRKPAGVHDPLYARLLVVREGKTTLALVGLDLLGWYAGGTLDIRDRWRRESGDAAREIFLHSTHQHSGPDTLGLWGPSFGRTGVNRSYEDRIKKAVVAELLRLEGRLVRVSVSGGHGSLNPAGLCRDSRDPQVIDPSLAVLRLKDAKGAAVATIVNWSCHPEVIGRENRLLTADFPGPLCARIEEKTGGECLFLNGAIGGLMTPDVVEETFEESARVGRAVADAALALKTPASGGGLKYRYEHVTVPVENSRYLLVLPALAQGHALERSGGRSYGKSFLRRSPAILSLRHALFGLPEDDRPWIRTVVSVLDLGPARLLGMPSEVFPELAIGGYDGKYSFGRPVVDPQGVPRDLASAPKGPYLRELIKAPVPMFVGLANDMLGYLVPAYDFKVRPSKTLLPRLPGHYEETNSVGPSATKILVETAERLLKEKR